MINLYLQPSNRHGQQKKSVFSNPLVRPKQQVSFSPKTGNLDAPLNPRQAGGQPHRMQPLINALSSRSTFRLPNPIKVQKLRQVLSRVHPLPGTLHSIDPQKPDQALKQLILLGNYLLYLKDELAKSPFSQNGYYYFSHPYLVIYQESEGATEDSSHHPKAQYKPPLNVIICYLQSPNNFKRLLQRPWRDLSECMKDASKEERQLGLKLILQAGEAITRLISCALNPELYNLPRGVDKNLTVLENHFNGLGTIPWSAQEYQTLSKTAFRYGFNIRHQDEWRDYTEALFQLLEEVADQLEQPHQPSTEPTLASSGPRKLGIVYQDVNGTPDIHDLSEQFPGGSIAVVRQVLPSDRDQLEALFHRQ